MKRIVIFFMLCFELFLNSCKKDDPQPTQKLISKTDALNSLSQNRASYYQDSTIFINSLSTITGLINNNLIQFENFTPTYPEYIPGGFQQIESFVPLRKEAGFELETTKLVSDILKVLQLSNNLKSSSTFKIPNTFKSAKGIWELQFTKDTKYQSFRYCQNPDRSYTYLAYVKTGESDNLVFKFPAYKIDLNAICNFQKQNNATLTISNFKSELVNFYYCLNGSSIQDTMRVARSINLNLEIDGVEIFNYQITNGTNRDKNLQYGPYEYSLKCYDFLYNFKVENDITNSSKYYSMLNLTKNDKILRNSTYISNGSGGQRLVSTCNIDSLNSNINFDYSVVTEFNTVKNGFKLKGSLSNEYIKAIENKYGKSVALSYDSATYYKIVADTSLLDIYYGSFELYQTSDGAKVGNLRPRYLTATNGKKNYVFVIIYNDGSKEPLSTFFHEANSGVPFVFTLKK